MAVDGADAEEQCLLKCLSLLLRFSGSHGGVASVVDRSVLSAGLVALMECVIAGNCDAVLLAGMIGACAMVPGCDASDSMWLVETCANSGRTVAQIMMARLLSNGLHIEPDLAEAYSWYERAANGGCARAMIVCGQWLETGRGGRKSETGALEWYKRAALAGNGIACRMVGNRMTSDKNAAHDWYLKGAMFGDVRCMCLAGRTYLKGDGVEKSTALAEYWIRRAAGEGSVTGERSLAALCRGRVLGADIEAVADGLELMVADINN